MLHTVQMSILKKIAKASVFLSLFAVVVLWENIKRWATIATLPGDITPMVEGLKWIIKALDTWLSQPPQWATYAALAIATIAYVAYCFGSERLIPFTRVIFRKDARIAEYKLISDDPTLATVKASLYAYSLLNNLNLTQIEPIDLSKIYGLDMDHASEDAILQALRRVDPLYRIERIIVQIVAGHHNLPKNLYVNAARSAIETARDEAAKDVFRWKQFENGFQFPTEASRSEWHKHRCAIARYNGIIWDIRRHLGETAKAWRTTTSEATARQLLEGIDIEKLR